MRTNEMYVLVKSGDPDTANDIRDIFKLKGVNRLQGVFGINSQAKGVKANYFLGIWIQRFK